MLWDQLLEEVLNKGNSKKVNFKNNPKKDNALKKNKKPVKNKDLWQQLDNEIKKHKISWFWIKGHSGHKENEIADQLANRAIDEKL